MRQEACAAGRPGAQLCLLALLVHNKRAMVLRKALITCFTGTVVQILTQGAAWYIGDEDAARAAQQARHAPSQGDRRARISAQRKQKHGAGAS